MAKQEPLQYGRYYHIFNRGNNRELIFRRDENYRFFLRRYLYYISPIALTFAYCLMPNHFHLLVRILTRREQEAYHQRFHLSERWNLLDPTLQFRKFFTSYAMAFNKEHKRKGSLFQKNFRRKSVDNQHYFMRLMTYVHQNPQKHGFVDDFREWTWSSYRAVLSEHETNLQRAHVLDWFGTTHQFINEHVYIIDETVIEPIYAGDWFA